MKRALALLRDLFGDTQVSEFGPLRLKTLRHALVEKGNSRPYVNQMVGRVKRVFKWGTEEELVPPSVFHGLQAVVSAKTFCSFAREFSPGSLS